MRGQTWLRAAGFGAARFVIALAVYGVAELLSTAVLGGADRPPLWVILLATALVAWLFWLTSGPIRRLVDLVVLGERAGGYEAGRTLLRRMATTLPVDEILPALAETAGRTMHSSRAEVRLLLSDGDSWSQVWPARAVADGAQVTVGVRHGGADVGEIEVDLADQGESDRDRDLLDDLARPAGLALSTVRLTVELRRRADELKDLTAALVRSNLRILDARRFEIARLAGEMQERVLPQLDRAESALNDVAGYPLDADPVDPARPDVASYGAGQLDAARENVAAALDALRVLARGIYPPRLADAGVEVSLEGWQQRSGVGVDVTVRGDEDALHRQSAVESCLYFVLVTALGALATPQRPAVVIDIGPAEVAADVIGAVAAGPNGSEVHTRAMQAVRDRVDAFGGRTDLTVDPGEPDGLRRAVLRVRIPLVETVLVEIAAGTGIVAVDAAVTRVFPRVSEGSGGFDR